MKKFIFLFCLVLVGVAGYSQKEISKESEKSRILERNQKKEAEKAKKEAARTNLEAMLISRQYILEVSFMNDQSKNFLNAPGRVDVSSSNNYLAIKSDKIVLQLETNSYQTSNWPFNNFPVNGTLSKYDIQKLKRPDDGYVIHFLTNGRIGVYSVTINVSTGGKADLKMALNNGVSLNLNGVLVPLGHSRIKPIFN